MEEGINYDLLAKYFSGEADTLEQKRVHKWKKENQREFEKIELIWKGKNQSSFNSKTAITNVWKKIDEKETKRLPRFFWIRSSAAAIILICIVALGWNTYSRINHKSSPLEIVVNSEAIPLHVNLPDGSVVTLNQNASLKYPGEFTSKNRTVELVGEAFFNVTHNPVQPFIVDLKNSEVTVLGTSFNISNSETSTEVLVRTGKVQFATTEEKVLLEPFEQGLYNSSTKKIKKKKDVPLADLEWMNKLMVYNDTPFKDVITDLVEIYGYKITLQDTSLRNCSYTGRLANLETNEMFELIAYALNVEVIKNGNDYLIKGEGC